MTKPDLIYTNYIKTTPEKLWAAITNPEFTRQYWGGHVNASDWKKGSKWQHEDTGNGNALRVAGEVLEKRPAQTLGSVLVFPTNPADISTVTFSIEPVDEFVRLDVIHGDFKADSAMADGVSKGWPLVLSSLKSFLETGKGINILAIKTCNPSKEAAA